MNHRLQGKVALITGGCSGIGLSTVETFVAEGAQVVVADLQAEAGAALEARFPGVVRYIRCDVTQEGDIVAALDLASQAFGGLDILFNNAGAPGETAGVKRMTAAGWDATLALLLRSVALGIHHAVPLMKARGGGAIVNTASIAGISAGYGSIAYSTAKGAVIHLTRCAAVELSSNNIRVNAVCPGIIPTPMVGKGVGVPGSTPEQVAAKIAETADNLQPIRRAGQPKDIANAVLYLASDESAFVTGIELVVDGGLILGPRHAWDRHAPQLIDLLLPPD